MTTMKVNPFYDPDNPPGDDNLFFKDILYRSTYPGDEKKLSQIFEDLNRMITLEEHSATPPPLYWFRKGENYTITLPNGREKGVTSKYHIVSELSRDGLWNLYYSALCGYEVHRFLVTQLPHPPRKTAPKKADQCKKCLAQLAIDKAERML